MSSIRINGRSEQMGEVIGLPSQEIPEAIDPGERSIARLMAALPLGSIALLDSEFTLPAVPEGKKPHRATFIDSSDLALGRDEARHQPRFGQMILNGPGLHERPILIGAKPFQGSEDEHPDAFLQREWAASNYLNSLGDRQLAYLPLGVWRTAKGINHLLSLYDHEVKSYDHVFWADKALNPEALRETVVEHALLDCMSGLGYLHGAGLAHTDAEAKNLAADFSGVRFIDLEGVQELPIMGTTIEDSPATTELIRHDIETFIDSTVQVEENRPEIAQVLGKPRMYERMAKAYRAGQRQSKREAGLKVPALQTSTDEYFKETVGHALTVASNKRR